MKILSLFKKRKTISDKVIDLSPPGVEANQRYFDTDFYRCKFHHSDLWPHHFSRCQFIECEFELRRSGRNHSSRDCNFDRCVFKFKKAYQYMFNNGQVFRSCDFTGTLKDSVFARHPLDKNKSQGDVIDCNFNELEFDVIDFRGIDTTSDLSFPNWPVVLLQYGAHLNPNYDKSHLPIEMRYYTVGYTTRLSGFTAIDLRTDLKDPEDLWIVAHDADFLNFTNKSEKTIPESAKIKECRELNKHHNQIHDKYRETFLSLITRASIVGISRKNEDVVLTVSVKGMDDAAEKGKIEIILYDCSKSDFVGGAEDKKADGYEKKFYLSGMDIDEDADTLILKGPRKNMGRLHLTYSHAKIYEC